MRYLLIFCCVVYLVNSKPLSERNLKAFSLEDVIPGRFSNKGFNGTWISDVEFIFKDKDGNLKRFNVDSLVETELVSEKNLNATGASGYVLSPDTKYLLLSKDRQAGFRHSSSARYMTYDIDSGKTVNIADSKLLLLAQWAPVGNGIAYVLDNNVFYRTSPDEGAVEQQLTFDGEENLIYNGIPDWVYEEEVFGSGSASWFSPDGKLLAIASFDDTDVEDEQYFNYQESPYPELIYLKYPKPGTKNPLVKLKVFDLSVSDPLPPKWVDIEAPVDEVSSDHILGSVTWASDKEIAPTWLNRRQNKSVLRICHVDTKVCQNALKIDEPNGWVDVTTPLFPKELTNEFLVIQPKKETSGTWRHLVRRGNNGEENAQISSGGFTVISILGYHSNNIFYLATSKTDAAERHVYKNDYECISCKITTPEGQCQYASASFSSDFKYIALTCSGPGPGYVTILETSTEAIKVKWEENLVLRGELSEYSSPQILDEDIPVVGGFNAKVRLLLPPELNVNDNTKAYPMIVYVYAGPNSVRVTDAFTLGYQAYVTTNRSIIYCMIDGRGSGYKGNEMLFQINNGMGTVEIEDQIAVTKTLQDKYKWINASQTGIWGWSYGGYATGMALATDEENIFACGISVAPVTSWRYYDSIYTERYMGFPTLGDNQLGYNTSDLTTKVEGLRGKNYLLIHGTADDNVHYTHAMILSRALQLGDVYFKQQSYPDEAHSLSGVLRHVYKTIDKFWTECFKLK